MTTYRNIHGRSIKAVATDPTAEVSEGEIWYNTGSDTFKSILSVEAWSSGGNLVTATALMAGAGTQTAGLGFGGYVGPGTPNVVNTTLEYNGSGWTVGGNLVAARSGMGGTGTQTAGLGFGGSTTIPRAPGEVANSEEYNGTAWTEGTNLNDALVGVGGLGTQTAAVGFGGGTPDTNATEHYDGTSWTNVPGTLTSARRYLQGCGTQTAGLTAGGSGTSSNLYDGTSWTAGADMNTSRPNTGSVSGIQTSALMSGGGSGGTPVGGKTELYNGTSWSEVSDMAVGRYSSAGANGGTTSASLAFGGYLGGTGYISSTEEWNRSANIITPSAWATGGNMPVAKRVGACSKGGDINSSLTFGGDTLPMGAGQPQVNTTEEYNGTSWTGGGNVGNNISGSAGAGTQTAMIGATGYSFPTPWGTAGASYIANAFEYDGSSWTNVTAYPTTGVGMMSLGTQTASLFGGGAQGGSPGPEANQKSKDYKEYNGSSWTTGGASNTFHSRSGGAGGTQTAGIIYGGYDGPGGNPSGRSDKVEEYNGTAWTSAITAPKESAIGSGFGTQTAFLYSGGQESPIPNSPGTTGFSFTTLVYDGTTMRTDANTATRRVYSGADGAIGTAAGFVAGGATSYSARTTATEEYSQGSSAINVKTLTQS